MLAKLINVVAATACFVVTVEGQTVGPTFTPSASTTGMVNITNAPVASVDATNAPVSSPLVAFNTTNAPVLSIPNSNETNFTDAPVVAPSTLDQAAFSTSPSALGGINYFDGPVERWHTALTGGTINKRNGVAVSPDGLSVWVTRANGRLDVLSASDGSVLFSYTPPSGPSFFSVTCESSVYFSTLNGEAFGAYTIVDQVSSAATGQDSTSRVVAIKDGTFEVMFISEPLEGKAPGTPVITRVTPSGEYIYLTHNTNMDSDDLDPIGHFSVISVLNNGTVIFTENVTTARPERIAPYTALSASHELTVNSKVPSREFNLNDMVFWTSSANEGRSGEGFTRAFQLPIFFEPESASDLSTLELRDTRWNALVRPAVDKTARGLYAFIRGSGVRGWSGATAFTDSRTWSAQLKKNEDISGMPIQHAGKLNTEEDTIFVPSAGSTFAAVEALNGEIVWEVDLDADFTAEPQVSPDSVLVYALQNGGTISAYDQSTGTTFWSVSCIDFTTTACMPDFRAEFSVSPDGLDLYIGDLLGNVRALRVGESKIPLFPLSTEAPSTAPVVTTDHPSDVPSGVPSMAPVVDIVPSDIPTAAPFEMETVVPTGGATEQTMAPSQGSATESPVASTELPTVTTSAPAVPETPSPITANPTTASSTTASPFGVSRAATSSAVQLYSSSLISTAISLVGCMVAIML